MKRTHIAGRGILCALSMLCSAFVTACAAHEDVTNEPQAGVSQAAISQATADSFYSPDNVLKIKIYMPPLEWDKVRNERPGPIPDTNNGEPDGECDYDTLPSVDRYQWRHVDSVSISGSDFGSGKTFTYNTSVEIKKKSFCGSISATKPSLKLKLKGTSKTDLGTGYLTLNNSIQDKSFLRQIVGYKLLEKAGLPHSRANLAQVYVNDKLVSDGVYINVEPLKESYMQNPTNGFATSQGNLYEFENDDFNSSRLQYIDADDDQSKYADKEDLRLADIEIAGGVERMKKVIDVDQFIRVFAMEFLLKHWDGYTGNLNNVYAYNDTESVQDPTVEGGNVKFKLIPSGIDQILKPDGNGKYFSLSGKSALGRLVINDPALLRQLKQQVAEYRDTVFARDYLKNDLTALIISIVTKVVELGEPPWFSTSPNALAGDVFLGFVELLQQLRLVRSAAYILSGVSATDSVYVRDSVTNHAMHASDTETMPGMSTDYEVVHRVLEDSRSDRWFVSPAATGFRLISEKYVDTHKWLHCSNSIKTPQNHYYVYTTPNEDTLGSKEFTIKYDALGSYKFTGLFTLSNNRNFQYLRFGTDDPTPGTGRQRVYQTGSSTASWLYWY